MLRIAVPNKGSLSEATVDLLREAGYRTRRDTKELVVTDHDNEVEFFYLRPRDIAVYVGSGTVRALDAGVHTIGKKLVEEAAESWMAAEHESRERTAEELSQLLYHAQVLMIASGITLDDVYAHL